MLPVYEEIAGRRGQQRELRSLMIDLSAFLAMAYRRAPLPVSANLVRRFANQPELEIILEIGSVLRRCLLLGDEAFVVNELRRQRSPEGQAWTALTKYCGNSSAPTIDRDGPGEMTDG